MIANATPAPTSLRAKSSLRALVVDDHEIVAEALKTGVPALRAFSRIDTANSLADAAHVLELDGACDLAILDLHLTDAQGRETLERFRERFPDVPVLVFSGDSSLEQITMAFECGARGFVPKTSPMSVIDGAIRLVLSGGSYVPPDAVQVLGIATPSARPAVSSEPRMRLTARQEQVFRLLLQGLPNKVIAARLDMAEGTAKAHLNTVFRVLNVRTRVEAILRARELGMI